MLIFPGLVELNGDKVEPNEDYENLKKEIAKVKPSGVKMSAYTPTNTAPASCPKVGDDWEAKSDPLPPVANAQACECMMDTVTCTVKDNVDEDNYGDIFGYICGQNDGEYCAGINRDSSIGPYGAYSMCTPKQQLAWALHQYSSNNANGCDFEGKATTQRTKEAGSECKKLLDEAGENGTGELTGPANGGKKDGESDDKKGAASGLSVPAFGAVSVLSTLAMIFM